jgi:hypothetical protein
MHPVSPILTRATTATPKKNQTTESWVNPASSPSTPLMPRITTPTVRTTSSFLLLPDQEYHHKDKCTTILHNNSEKCYIESNVGKIHYDSLKVL